MKVGTIVKTLVEESKKTEIYSVWNFDMKFDAKHALGARRTHESILVLLYTRLLNNILYFAKYVTLLVLTWVFK